MAQRHPYEGTDRKVVFSIDVGTSESTISFSVQEPDIVPSISTVARAHNQDGSDSELRIPTVAWYNALDMRCAIGTHPSTEIARDQQWTKATLFKLLCFKQEDINGLATRIPIDFLTLFSDFYGHLFLSAKEYINRTHEPSIWRSVEEGNAEFVITHPSAFGPEEKSVLREAAVLSNLVPHDQVSRRVKLVSEGEAALHFCLENGYSGNLYQDNKGVMVIDSGGWLASFSAYAATYHGDKRCFKAITTPRTCVAGFEAVVKNAQGYLKSHFLSNARYTPRIEKIMEGLIVALQNFRQSEDDVMIPVGDAKETEASLNIARGTMRVEGHTLATQCFEPCLQKILTVVATMAFASTQPISTIFLVGGFFTNDWIYSKVRKHLESLGLGVFRPELNILPRAISEGAVAFGIDKRASVRAAPYSYGIIRDEKVHQSLRHADQAARPLQQYNAPSGEKYIRGLWSPIIEKGTLISNPKEFRIELNRQFSRTSFHAHLFSVEIYQYIGLMRKCKWADSDEESFQEIGILEADMREIKRAARAHTNPQNPMDRWYTLTVHIVLRYSMDELEGCIAWKDNGHENRTEWTVLDVGPSTLHVL